MAASALVEGGTTRPSTPRSSTGQLSPEALAVELERAARQVRSNVDACAHSSVWTPSGADAPTFWRRRTLSEDLLHYWDAVSALGGNWDPAPGVIEEATDEFISSRIPQQAGRRSGTVTLNVGSACWSVAVAVQGHASARATPTDLWLWLNRRSDAGRMAMGGSLPPITELETTLDDLRRARR